MFKSNQKTIDENDYFIDNNAVISNIKTFFPELNGTYHRLRCVERCDLIVSLCGSLWPKAKLYASCHNQLMHTLKAAINSCSVQNQCNLCGGCCWVSPVCIHCKLNSTWFWKCLSVTTKRAVDDGIPVP